MQEDKFDFPRSEHLTRVFESSNSKASGGGAAIKTTRLRDAVIERLAKKIMDGTYPIGIALPNDDELCDELAVSRSSIREAVRSLAAKGAVETRTRVGTLALSKDRWSLLDTDVLRWTYAYGTDSEFDRSLIVNGGVKIGHFDERVSGWSRAAASRLRSSFGWRSTGRFCPSGRRQRGLDQAGSVALRARL